MSAAETRGGQAFIFQKWSSRIQRALDEANKDNDLIYHARVPDLSTLPALGKHAVAKATDFAEPLSSNFQGETNLRTGSRFAPIQWETALLCNDVSHWLGVNLESAQDLQLVTCKSHYAWLAYQSQGKMVATLQKTFANVFSWILYFN